DRKHSRFGVSRRERFEALERTALKALPSEAFEVAEWKEATLHADCYVQVDAVYYSAPHIHRHKRLRVKLTETQVELFLDLERLAVHPRSRHRAMGGASVIRRTSPRTLKPTTRPRPSDSSRKRASSMRICISSLSSCSMSMCTRTCVAPKAWCAAARRRSRQQVMSSQANASSAPSRRCVATTRSACRTSRHCSRRLAKPPSRPMSIAIS